MKTELKSKKHYIVDIIIILAVTGLTIYYLLKSGVFNQLDKLSLLPLSGLFAILLIIFAAILFQSFVFYNSGQVHGAGLNYVQSTNAYLMGFLGSGVTPLKSGHFPFIFYYYSKEKVNFEKSLSLVCTNQIVFSLTTIITYLIIMILCLIKNTVIVVSGNTIGLWLAALAGFLFNLGTMLLVVLMAYSKKFHNLIVKTGSFILFKLKKIESRQAYEEEHAYKMKIYREQIDYVFKHLYKFILPIYSFLLFLLFTSSVPYVIYLFFTGETFSLSSYLFFFSLNQAMTYVTNIIPVPGGTGVAEFSFLTIFSTVFAADAIGAAMIIWRVTTYYLPIIISFFIFLGVMAKNRPNSNKTDINNAVTQTNKEPKSNK